MTHAHGGRVFAAARELGLAAAEVLDFSANINPLGPSPRARRALEGALEEIVHYPDDEAQALREGLAGRHGLPPEHIVVGNGATELIHLLPRALGDRLHVIVQPAFSEYARAIELAGLNREDVFTEEHSGFQLTDALAEKLLATRGAVVWLANPANPTGVLIPAARLENLARDLAGRGGVLIVDEAFIDYREAESLAPRAVDLTNLVVLRSLTKFFAMPGLRAGYLAACRWIARAVARLQPPWSVNHLAQAAAVAGLEDEEYAARSRSLVEVERAFLTEGLAALGLRVYPGAANYLMFRCPGGVALPRLEEKLAGRGILIRNCGNFPGLDESYGRTAVRTRHENTRLLAALGEALEE